MWERKIQKIVKKRWQKVCQFGKRLYLCTRFRKGTGFGPRKRGSRTVPWKQKKEIFDRLQYKQQGSIEIYKQYVNSKEYFGFSK